MTNYNLLMRDKNKLIENLIYFNNEIKAYSTNINIFDDEGYEITGWDHYEDIYRDIEKWLDENEDE